MATISGTIQGITLVAASMNGAGTRKVYLVTAAFGAYTGAADTAQVQAVGAAIAARVRNGKTHTVRWAAPALPGVDTNAQAIHFTGTAVAAATISTDDITGQLSTNASTATEITTSTACSGVGILVGIDES